MPARPSARLSARPGPARPVGRALPVLALTLGLALVASTGAAFSTSTTTPTTASAVSAASATGVKAAATAVVKDTFEDGTVGSWTVKASQNLTLDVVSGGASATSGHSLRVTGATAKKKVKVGPSRVIDTSLLTAGQWYLVSGSARTPSGKAPATFTLTTQQSPYGLLAVPARNADGWAQPWAVFQWKGAKKAKLTLAVRASATCSGDALPNSFLIDDVTLTPVDAVPSAPSTPLCGGTDTPTPTTSTSTTQPAGPRVCDLYATGGTPCVAAHSTTRALYAQYSGRLYQVQRASDGATKDITPVTAGGAADASAQDSFCSGTTCQISVIYDQTGRGNHLTQAPPGDFKGPATNSYDNLAGATSAPTSVYGRKVYGVFVSPGTGYRNNATNGVATGDQAEGMYAVLDGSHANGGCCFDYGNAETNARNNGNGTMEAIYFGTSKGWGYGAGTGPWIMADLENGLFSGWDPKYNAGDPTITHRYLTATLKGGPNQWSIRGGDATSGGLSTFYAGPRPNKSGYDPMKKEGAIILGIGGDNSISARGTFYEGAMTAGYPSDATENAVQADIVAAGYTGGPAAAVTREIRNRASDLCLDDYDWKTAPGAEVRQWTCNSNAVQDWEVRAASDGYVTLTNAYSYLCLDDYNWNTAPGSEARLWSCNGFPVQEWRLDDAGNGWSTIVNRHTGLCLGGVAGDTAAGALISQQTCDGTGRQQWRIS